MNVPALLELLLYLFVMVMTSVSGDFVLFNYSPLVSKPGRTSFVCADLTSRPGRSKFVIKRLFPWRGTWRTSASVARSPNLYGLKYSWNYDATRGAGAFACGTGRTKITSFKMQATGKLRPEHFSQVVPIGGKILIRMKPTLPVGNPSFKRILWSKNGARLRLQPDKIWQVENGRALVIKNVTKADQGVYMANYFDQRILFAAATNIIVRGCPFDRWFANCSRRCQLCKNGGHCDTVTGRCICPLGFRGTHCEIACSTNYFGPTCSKHCKEITTDGTCAGLQYCQTTGCSCMSGWKGPDCRQGCPANFYGAGCTERCLCLNGGTCDPRRGCICPPGWYGPSCKSSSDHGVYPEDINIRNGILPRRATTAEREPDIVGLEAIPSFMLNPGQRVTLRCSVTGYPLPIDGEIVLKRSDSETFLPNRTITSTKDATSVTTSIFYPRGVSYHTDSFSCEATTRAGTATKYFNITTAVPPQPINPPEALERKDTKLVINLNSEQYVGDGPIVSKVVFFKRHNETNFMRYNKSIYHDNVTISPLDTFTAYDFKVVLYREGGESGMGPAGPVATITTDCGTPTSAPTIKEMYAITNTTLYIKWDVPKPDEINGNIIGYKITYYPLHAPLKWAQSIDFSRVDRNSASLKHLRPSDVYGVKIQLQNCAKWSPFSEEARFSMGKLKKPNGPRVAVVNITIHRVEIMWDVPSNSQPYVITTYEFEFREAHNDSPNAIKQSANVSEKFRAFHQLAPFTSYSFRVRAYNHEGPGNFSDLIILTTSEDAPTKPLNFRAVKFSFDRIQLKWDHPEQTNGVIRKYDVQLSEEGKAWQNISSVSQVNQTTLQVSDLKEYTAYRFRVKGVTVRVGAWSDVIEQKTMSKRPLEPPHIVDIAVTSPQSVAISWLAPTLSEYVENITLYKIIYTDDIRQMNERRRSKVVFGDARSLKIEGLRENTVYEFKIAAKTTELGDYSEEMTTRTSRLGLPPPPFNVKVLNVSSSAATIAWSIKKGYRITIVKVRHLTMGSKALSPIVEADQDGHMKLESLIPDTQYEVELIATNYIGDSSGNPVASFHTDVDAESNTFPDQPFEKSMMFKIVLAILGGLILVIVFLVAGVYCRCRSVPKKPCPTQMELDSMSTNNRLSAFGSLSQGGAIISRSGTLLSNHSIHSANSRAVSTYSGQIFPESLILPWENILFEDIPPLGVGNFGQVVKAVVQKDGRMIQTAVKMLKEGSTVDDKRDFLAELDTMVRIGNHKNVISLVGACEHDCSMYLCTEFAPNGNLLQYLRKSRKAEIIDISYTTLSQTQLLQFALDVSQGMAYLSEKQLIHRDLAARNILLGERLTCKIADFGLSRGEGVYVKKTVSRLPIRWMAIESLNYNVYTTKSDVWSFGVLLWEIVSLGGTPYCGMSCAELYEKLPTGYRMEKPLNCDDEMFALMYQCWKDRPYDRPTFSQLCVALERMSDARSSRNYVNTAIFEDFKFANIDVNEEEG